MDPLSITASCITVLAASISISRALLVTCRSIKHTSEDIRWIVEDLQAFQPFLESLQAQIQHLAAQRLSTGTLNIIQNIKNPLTNCDKLMKAILAKIRSRDVTDPHSIARATHLQHVKWVFFKKSEVQELSKKLNASKLTLHSILLQLLLSTTPPDTRAEMMEAGTQTSTVLDELTTEEPAISNQLSVIDFQQEMTEFRDRCLSEIRASIADLHSSMLAHILHILADHTRQPNALTARLSSTRSEHDSDHAVSNDIFFDCVSRCSGEINTEAVDGICRSFSGTASYYLERGRNFFPEMYSMSVMLQDRFFMAAAVETVNDGHTVECCLYYAASPRQWYRIHMYGILENDETAPQLLPNSVVKGLMRNHIPPKAIQIMLETILQDVELFNPITQLIIPIQEYNGVLQFDFCTVRSKKEHDHQNVTSLLERVRNLGCRESRESDLVTTRRYNANIFVVIDNSSCEYIEYKLPFANVSEGVDCGYDSFVQDMMKAINISNCSGVPKFIGIVVDNLGQHIKGYLSESTSIGIAILAFAKVKNYTIPWCLRQLWAKQTIIAMSDVHQKGIVLGRTKWSLSYETDVLLFPAEYIGTCRDMEGRLAPELRRENPPVDGDFTKESDIFQLGLMLWALVENLPCNKRDLCIRAGCTSRPYYTCTAPHTNPVSLPFSEGSNSILREIIDKCRSADPRDRPTARSIAEEIHLGEDATNILQAKNELRTIIQQVSVTGDDDIWCGECWLPCTEDHFHCYICDAGDFDLCPSCISDGLHCWSTEHHLFRKRQDRWSNITEEVYVPECSKRHVDLEEGNE